MKTKSLPLLYIVVPSYNEEEVLPITSKKFVNKITDLIKKGKINANSKILFVDDGSKDKTWDIIKKLSKSDRHIQGISLSRNRGHQNALLAGLMEVKDKCNICVSIDCDGQDDINAIDEMLVEYNKGFDVVYGVRSNRDTDKFLKKFTAQTFYKLLNVMGVESVYNHADYRLLSSKVLKEFANYKEVNLYLRGLVPLIGFKSSVVYYERNERLAGKSHYPITKMVGLASDGITSLSTKPTRYILGFGLIVSFVSFIFVLISLFSARNVAISVVCLLLGCVLVALGVIGEYIGKIYLEVKQRPRYIIEERTYLNSKK